MKHAGVDELVALLDGELEAERAAAVRSHVAGCGECRARVEELDGAMRAFAAARAAGREAGGEGARERLRARLAEESRGWRWRWVAAACVLAMAGWGAAWISGWGGEARVARAMPDPRLTPGETAPVTLGELCAGEIEREPPREMAWRVFAAYGIRDPEPGAWEVDYLITPALGGADSARNFWPQPYRNTVWSAHVKDALEDVLRKKVCAGEVELETAQRDLAEDWIAAYRKYFRTAEPLRQHAGFLKDRPWE